MTRADELAVLRRDNLANLCSRRGVERSTETMPADVVPQRVRAMSAAATL